MAICSWKPEENRTWLLCDCTVGPILSQFVSAPFILPCLGSFHLQYFLPLRWAPPPPRQAGVLQPQPGPHRSSEGKHRWSGRAVSWLWTNWLSWGSWGRGPWPAPGQQTDGVWACQYHLSFHHLRSEKGRVWGLAKKIKNKNKKSMHQCNGRIVPPLITTTTNNHHIEYNMVQYNTS